MTSVRLRSLRRFCGLTASTGLLAAGIAVLAVPAHAVPVRTDAHFTANVTVPVPPASNYAGSGGGDGWAVAMTSSRVYNVFHHASDLRVACHLQADASACWDPKEITDAGGSGFATSGHPGLHLDQSNGHLLVFATRVEDAVAGVVCIDTTKPDDDPDPFCGFTPLTSAGKAPLNGGISAISAPALVGDHWYAFNYVDQETVGPEANRLMCFDITTVAPCPAQPFDVSLGAGAAQIAVDSFPPPAVAAIGDEVLVPADLGGHTVVGCFDVPNSRPCGGSFPLTLDESYASSDGAAFPSLDRSGSLVGFCLPTATTPCFDLDGHAAPTPADIVDAVGATSGWNGPAVVIGPRVYIPNGNTDSVDCYDFSTSKSCVDFPKSLSNLDLLYTVNPDPQRPTCLWVNADGGDAQIQNFDAYTGGACGDGPVRVLASAVVAPASQCEPSSWSSLSVLAPSRKEYSSGEVAFQDSDAVTIPGTRDKPLDAGGGVDLSSLDLSTGTGLPQFLISLLGTADRPAQVVVQLAWTGVDDDTCVRPGTTKTGGSRHLAPVPDSRSAAQPCAQALFVGVRGSGQTASDGDGFGDEVNTVRKEVDFYLQPSVSLRQVYVDYRADKVFPDIPTNIPAYLASISDGVSKIRAVLKDSAARCPKEKWILAGYSQGALVVNKIVREFPQADRYGQIDLIADPARVPGQTGVDVGTARPGYGVFFARNPFTATALPASLQHAVVSFCDDGDIVCDFGNVNLVTGVPSGVATHLNYAAVNRDGDVLTAIGGNAAVSTGLPTLPPSGPIVLSAPQGGLQGGTGITLQGGSSVPVSVTNLSGNEPIHIVLHSSLVDLGWVHSTGDGTLSFNLDVPSNLPAGAHELVLVTAHGNLVVPFAVAPAASATPPTSPPPTMPSVGSAGRRSTAASGRPGVLAATGRNDAEVARLGVVLLALGLTVAICGRRRADR